MDVQQLELREQRLAEQLAERADDADARAPPSGSAASASGSLTSVLW